MPIHGVPKTVEEYTVEALREAITRGQFRPGQRLNQTELANWLGVSRMPIREALRQLETEGLVTFHPRRGAVVKSISSRAAAEIYEIRALLESHAMRLSIPRLTKQHLQRLEEMFNQMEQEKDEYERRKLRTKFYIELYTLADRPLLVSMIQRLRDEIGRYLLTTTELPHSHEAHEVILNLCREQDAEGAAQYMYNHLRNIGEALYQLSDRDAPANE